MAYVNPNYKTKKAFLAAVKSGVEHEPWSPGPFPVQQNGSVTIEGPHYPEPHRWYAVATVKNGKVVSAK